MESQLEDVLRKCMKAPSTTGVIILDNLGLCIGLRGELLEGDAGPIGALIASATKGEESKGEVSYKSKRLQFHKTSEYTLALLRNHTLSGLGNADDTPISENEVADTALRGLGFSNSEN